MNRIDRLSAILIQLQTKRIIKADEIANRFEISTRTVYRDIRALEEAGIPIGAEAGKGYYLVDGYHLPPVMFSRQEAGSLIIAEKLVNKLGDKSIRNQFVSAVNKIKSVLPDKDKDYLDDMSQNIQVFHNPPWTDKEEFPNNFITQIQQSLAESKCLEITYFSAYKKNTNTRVVEPLGLCFYGMAWHLIAFCKLRNDYRDFRLDRLKSLKISDDTTYKSSRLSLRDYFKMQWEKHDLLEAVVRFDKSNITSIGTAKYYFGFIDEKEVDGFIEMSFAIEEYSYLAHWLLSFGKHVKVVRPLQLEAEIKEIVKNLAKLYLG